MIEYAKYLNELNIDCKNIINKVISINSDPKNTNNKELLA